MLEYLLFQNMSSFTIFKYIPYFRAQNFIGWSFRKLRLTHPTYRKLLYSESCHWSIQLSILYIDWQQLSSVSDWGHFQPCLDMPRIKPGIFCMQGKCSTTKLQRFPTERCKNPKNCTNTACQFTDKEWSLTSRMRQALFNSLRFQ